MLFEGVSILTIKLCCCTSEFVSVEDVVEHKKWGWSGKNEDCTLGAITCS